jgi:two-component system response regulator AtoC
MATLVIIEDEPVLARNVGKTFSRRGFTVHEAGTIAAGLHAVDEMRPEVVLLDLRLPDGSGLDALPRILALDPDVAVIMMTAYGSVSDAVQAMQHGARDFVLKPFELDEIRLRVERAVGAARAQREIAYYRERDASAATIVGESAAMARMRELVARLVRATAPRGAAPTVLLLGETGSGKGHVARALHAAGGRRDRPFIEVNCTALPEASSRPSSSATSGRVHRCQGASRPLRDRRRRTIFLDDRKFAGLAQAKFLKAVEEKTVRRIGATALRAIDVQIVAATSRDIEAAVQLGEFRDDLYQRLSVAVVRIPPLRERGEDSVLLARTFLQQASQRYAAPQRALSAAAEDAIRRHPWPGTSAAPERMERVVLSPTPSPSPPPTSAWHRRRSSPSWEPAPVARCASTSRRTACRSRPSSGRSWWPPSTEPPGTRPRLRACSGFRATRCATA